MNPCGNKVSPNDEAALINVVNEAYSKVAREGADRARTCLPSLVVPIGNCGFSNYQILTVSQMRLDTPRNSSSQFQPKPTWD